MLSKTTKMCARGSLFLIEAAIVLGFVVIIAAGALVWRVSSSPLDLDFAKPTILEALRDEERGLEVNADKIFLHWPDVGGPLLLGLEGGRVYREAGALSLAVDEVALGLNKARLLIGQISPEFLLFKGPSLNIIRKETGGFEIGFDVDSGAMGPYQQNRTAMQTILGFLQSEDDATEAPLARLQSFRIEDAQLVIDDRVLGMTWQAITADAVFSPAEGGLNASIEIEVPSQLTEQPARLSAKAIVSDTSEAVLIEGQVERLSPALVAQKIPELQDIGLVNGLFDAKFKASLDDQMSLQNIDLTVFSSAGHFDVPDEYEKPLEYADLGVSLLYDRASTQFNLRKASVNIDGIAVEANAEVLLGENNINGSARIEINEMAQSAFDPLWPQSLRGDAAERWIVHKLSDGVFSNLYAQADIAVTKDEQGWDFTSKDAFKNLQAGFDFENMSVNYRAPLEPVKEAKGKGVFLLDEEKLRIDIESAKLFDLDIPQAELEFYNIIEKGKGTADIHIDLNGALPSVLQYIAAEPLSIKPGFDVANSAGNANLQINLGFPTKDDTQLSDFNIDISGTLTDAKLPKIVQNLDLVGGPFAMQVDNEKLSVSGKGQLDGRAIDLAYESFLESAGKPYESKVTASMSVDPGLRSKFGMDLSAFLEGSVDANIVYKELAGSKAKADIVVDLTPATFFVDPFDYTKTPGQKGSATMRAHLQNGELKTLSGLKGTAPGFKLETSRLSFVQKDGETELSHGKVSRFTVGETIAELEFETTPTGQVKIVMDGPFMDLRPFLDNSDEKIDVYDKPPMQVYISVDAMRTSDDETVQYGKLFADIDAEGKFNQLEMDAIAGNGDIYLRYKPDGSGKRVFRFEADDAGATLKAFDLYDNIIGGQMVIYGEPIRGVFDRNLLGRAELSNFKVVEAPALARLIGALSLPGVGALLNNDGLAFTKLEADFDWLYRPEGSLLVLKDGRTSGNALGLTFDGTFDNAQNTLNVSGTIIPLSGINRVIGSIPIIGDILTGGTGALIAATYDMKGAGNEPEISVNPLSVLTPGILRRVLFEN